MASLSVITTVGTIQPSNYWSILELISRSSNTMPPKLAIWYHLY